MTITSVDIVPISLRKDDPNWHFALGGTPASEGFIVRLTDDDGVSGYGSAAAATYYGLTLAGLRNALELFRPILVGRDPFDGSAISADLDRAVKGHERAKSAIDVARHDLMARSLGIPVHDLLGGRTRDTVPVIRILALDPPDTVADKAARLVADGYRFLKIKIDGDVDLDTARVRAVRDRVGPDITLTADANQTYDRPTAIRALRQMEPLGLALLEQPLAATDLAGLRDLRGRTSVRIEADESANTLDEVRRLLDAEAVDSINLKVSHLGGIRPAAIAAAMCAAAGVAGRMGGGTVGSQLLAAPTLHLLTATPTLTDPSEVAEFMRLADDPASGLHVHDGLIDIPDGPGLGVEVAFDGAP